MVVFGKSKHHIWRSFSQKFRINHKKAKLLYLKLYQQFRDPHSSFDTASREYSFMTIGPVSPLSFAGTPLFFNAFSDVEEFIKSNGLITQGKML
jgi:hypothetical protein